MSRRAWILFASVSLIWGVPYLFIKIALDGGASPMLVAWGRVAIGAALLLPIAWKLGYLDGLRSKAKPLVAFSIAECGLPWWLIPLGEQHVSSSLAAILIASLPLVTALLAFRLDQSERVRRAAPRRACSSASAGVVLLLGIDVGGQRQRDPRARSRSSARRFCYAVGLFIVKRHFSDVNPIGAVAVALAISTVMLAPGRDRLDPRGRGERRRDRFDRGARRRLLGAGADPVLRPDRRRRRDPRQRDHLREPGGRGGAGRRPARREPGRGGRRGHAADPRRLVALDRRPDAARPRRDRHRRSRAGGAARRPRACSRRLGDGES